MVTDPELVERVVRSESTKSLRVEEVAERVEEVVEVSDCTPPPPAAGGGGPRMGKLPQISVPRGTLLTSAAQMWGLVYCSWNGNTY